MSRTAVWRWHWAIEARTGNLSYAGLGAAYGTAKSGVGVSAMGVMRPELVMRSIIPVVMAGVIGIYGLIIAVIVGTNSTYTPPRLSPPPLYLLR